MSDTDKKIRWAEKYVKNFGGIDQNQITHILNVVVQDVNNNFDKCKIKKEVIFDGYGKSITLPTYTITWVFNKDSMILIRYKNIMDQSSEGSVTINWTGCDFEVIDEKKEVITFDYMSKELIDYVLDLLYRKTPMKITHEYVAERQF